MTRCLVGSKIKRVVFVPLIGEFLGVRFYIYYHDHLPPHLHLLGPGYAALVSIPEGKILAGRVPERVKTMATEWVQKNGEALIDNWRRARQGEPLARVSAPE